MKIIVKGAKTLKNNTFSLACILSNGSSDSLTSALFSIVEHLFNSSNNNDNDKTNCTSTDFTREVDEWNWMWTPLYIDSEKICRSGPIPKSEIMLSHLHYYGEVNVWSLRDSTVTGSHWEFTNYRVGWEKKIKSVWKCNNSFFVLCTCYAGSPGDCKNYPSGCCAACFSAVLHRQPSSGDSQNESAQPHSNNYFGCGNLMKPAANMLIALRVQAERLKPAVVLGRSRRRCRIRRRFAAECCSHSL